MLLAMDVLGVSKKSTAAKFAANAYPFELYGAE